MATTFGGPASRPDQTLSWNMTLIGHHELSGFGGIGEGIAVQKTRDGRRILWLAHESAPKNFTAVDITDPSNLKQVVQTDLPHAQVRSNSLDVVGDIMAVAYQTKDVGAQPAGFDLFDIATPESPRLIAHFDASGPHSRGVRVCGLSTVVRPAAGRDFTPLIRDDQFTHRCPQSVCQRKSVVVSGTRRGRNAPHDRPVRYGFGHMPASFPNGPIVYIGYDGGAVVLISQPVQPTLVSNWRYSPPFNGFCHTVLPLLSRDLLIVADECVRDGGEDWPKLVRVVDARLSQLRRSPFSDASFESARGGYGAHNCNLPNLLAFG